MFSSPIVDSTSAILNSAMDLAEIIKDNCENRDLAGVAEDAVINIAYALVDAMWDEHRGVER
jgi:hypothetical protein